MKIKETDINDILLINIEEKEANLSVSDTFRNLVLDRIASGKTKLVISFKKVEYVDSSFLGALVAILKKLLPLNGKVILTEINSDIQNLFEITRLDKVFTLESSLDKALQQF